MRLPKLPVIRDPRNCDLADLLTLEEIASGEKLPDGLLQQARGVSVDISGNGRMRVNSPGFREQPGAHVINKFVRLTDMAGFVECCDASSVTLKIFEPNGPAGAVTQAMRINLANKEVTHELDFSTMDRRLLARGFPAKTSDMSVLQQMAGAVAGEIIRQAKSPMEID